MSVLPWFVIAALVALNAFYVAAEFAAVAVERSQIALLARQGRPRAGALAALLDDGAALDRYIAACQIGITLSSLVAGAYGQASFGLALGPWLATTFELGHATAQTSAFVLVLFTLTTLQVVLGELVPKSLALQFPARVAPPPTSRCAGRSRCSCLDRRAQRQRLPAAASVRCDSRHQHATRPPK